MLSFLTKLDKSLPLCYLTALEDFLCLIIISSVLREKGVGGGGGGEREREREREREIRIAMCGWREG